ncbi:hypothetical protein ACWCQM_20640 [Streptomyces sp. NPDC002125]
MILVAHSGVARHKIARMAGDGALTSRSEDRGTRMPSTDQSGE